MSTQTTIDRDGGGRGYAVGPPASGGRFDRLLLWGAPAAALLAGIAAEWLDFGALRYPLLLVVLLGVLATSYAIAGDGERIAEGGRGKRRPHGRSAMLSALTIGVATWGAAETLYVMLHAVQREAFEAERFGPQWRQALGLIGVHALFLGAPTGVVAGAVLWLRSRLWPHAIA